MRVVLLANNLVGLRVTEFLAAQPDEIVAVVVHPAERARYRDEIQRAAGVPASRMFEGDTLHQDATLSAIKELAPEIGVSAFFGYILREPFIEGFPHGLVNIHPSFLPHNRGAHPNAWSIIDGTPAGVTVHFIDRGVDTGDIIAQAPEPVLPTDTGETLYRRLEKRCVQLFTETWPAIRLGNVARTPQDPAAGSVHRAGELAEVGRIDRDRTYRAGELLDVVRALTFPPYDGARIEVDGGEVQLRLQLESLPRADGPAIPSTSGNDDGPT